MIVKRRLHGKLVMPKEKAAFSSSVVMVFELLCLNVADEKSRRS